MRSLIFLIAALHFIIFPTASFAQQENFAQIIKKYENTSGGYKQFKFGMTQQEVEVIIKHLYGGGQLTVQDVSGAGPDLILPHTLKYTVLDVNHYASTSGKKAVFLLLNGQKGGDPCVFYLFDNRLVTIISQEFRGQYGIHKDYYDGIKEKYSGRKYVYDGKKHGFDAHAMCGRNENNVVCAETIYDRSNEMTSFWYCEPAFYDAAKDAAEKAVNQQKNAKKSLID